jgi:hypothetical protein
MQDSVRLTPPSSEQYDGSKYGGNKLDPAIQRAGLLVFFLSVFIQLIEISTIIGHGTFPKASIPFKLTVTVWKPQHLAQRWQSTTKHSILRRTK